MAPSVGGYSLTLGNPDIVCQQQDLKFPAGQKSRRHVAILAKTTRWRTGGVRHDLWPDNKPAFKNRNFKQTGETSVIDWRWQVLYQPFKLSPSAAKQAPDADEPGQIWALQTHFIGNKVAECD